MQIDLQLNIFFRTSDMTKTKVFRKRCRFFVDPLSIYVQLPGSRLRRKKGETVYYLGIPLDSFRDWKETSRYTTETFGSCRYQVDLLFLVLVLVFSSHMNPLSKEEDIETGIIECLELIA